MKKEIIFSLLSLFVFSGAAFASDCRQAPGKNCVDLCEVDLGNRLNHVIESSELVGRYQGGSCRYYDHGRYETGTKTETKYKVTHYEVCEDARHVEIETTTICN